MKRILFMTVLLTAAMLLVGCGYHGSATAPTADAPDSSGNPGSKDTPAEYNDQADATSDESVVPQVSDPE